MDIAWRPMSGRALSSGMKLAALGRLAAPSAWWTRDAVGDELVVERLATHPVGGLNLAPRVSLVD